MSTQNAFGSVRDDRIVNETALDNGEEAYTVEQLNKMSNTMLRRLAANADTDVVNGKSTKMEIISYHRCQRSLTEYSED